MTHSKFLAADAINLVWHLMATISGTRKLTVTSSFRQELCVADLTFLAPYIAGSVCFGGQKGSCGIAYQAVRSQRRLSLSALGAEW